MSESRPQDFAETPTVVVRVYRDGRLWLEELCESEDEAALAVEEWSELEGVTCEVDDLSVRHRAGDILAPEPPEADSEESVGGRSSRRDPPGVRHGRATATGRGGER